MKRRLTMLAILLVLGLTASMQLSAASKKTTKDISSEFKSKTLSKNSFRLTWKKHKMNKYVIYKVTNNGYGKKVKLKTVSGNKTSATIKAAANQALTLYIKGANKKTNTIYEAWTDAVTGLSCPQWDDYLYAEGKCSISSIALEAYSYDGLPHKGFQIFRKEGGDTSYKKIKTLKTKKKHIRWTDTSVKAKKTYYYKIRSYTRIKGGIFYSKMSEEILRYAVNYLGTYMVTDVSADGKKAIKLTSDENNGDSSFSMYSLAGAIVPTENDKECYLIKEYSTDGQTWTSLEKDDQTIDLKAGASIYFSFEKSTYDPGDDDYSVGLLETRFTYRGLPCFLDIPLAGGTSRASLDSESIH